MIILITYDVGEIIFAATILLSFNFLNCCRLIHSKIVYFFNFFIKG